jgi:hypothetical protein
MTLKLETMNDIDYTIRQLFKKQFLEREVDGHSIRFVPEQSRNGSKESIQIYIGRFIIANVFNNRLEISLPRPLKEYFKVIVNGIGAKYSVRMYDASTSLRIETEYIPAIINKNNTINLGILLGDTTLFSHSHKLTLKKLISDIKLDNKKDNKNREKYYIIDVNGVKVHYLFPNKKNRGMITVQFDFSNPKINEISNNNNNINNKNIDEYLEYGEKEKIEAELIVKNHKQQNICGILSRSMAACYDQISKTFDDTGTLRFDQITTDCYLKEDWLFYSYFINKLIEIIVPGDNNWKLSTLRLPDNTITFNIKINRDKSITLCKKQHRIYWVQVNENNNSYKIKDENQSANSKFAAFKNGHGFDIPKGIWKPDEFEDVDLSDDINNIDENYIKHKIGKQIKKNGPQTSEDLSNLEVQIKDKLEEKKKQNCCSLYKFNALIFNSNKKNNN